MNIETFLLFLMKHNATIIEVLVGMTLLATLLLAVRSFLFAKDEPVSSGTSSIADLELSLKKILEKANQVPQTPSGQADASLLAEIGKLKTELEIKQKKIEELSAAGGQAAGAAGAEAGGAPVLSVDEREKLEAQIKELQAKLSEYEIISEDIADLSFYKEQNARLQKELEASKGGAPAAAPTAAAPAAVAVPPAAIDPVAESMSALTTPAAPAPPAPPVAAAPVEEAPAVENVVDADLMAEFDAAVEKQKAASGEASADLGALNMDKMLAEAADIKTDIPEIKAEDVLSQSLDENKLLQEADAMKKEVGNPEDKKLMGQFENFVKKGDA